MKKMEIEWKPNPKTKEAMKSLEDAAADLVRPVVSIGADIQKDGIRIGIIGASAMAAPYLKEVVDRLSECEKVKTVEIIKTASCGMTESLAAELAMSEIKLIGLSSTPERVNATDAALMRQKTLDEIQPIKTKKKKRRKKYWERPGFGETE